MAAVILQHWLTNSGDSTVCISRLALDITDYCCSEHYVSNSYVSTAVSIRCDVM